MRTLAKIPNTPVNHYSIKDLERLSGIKAHTIRIWEQRYGIIQPERTDTNIRYYTDNELKRILNISLLNQNHYKISRIAQMTDEEIHREVMSVIEVDPAIDNQLSSLTVAMVELDEERFEKVLSTNILRHGFEKTMVNIIFPFLERVGFMWMTGTINPAQEHFMSNLIRQKLIVAIDGQGTASNSNGSYMLFCPEGEYHEIGLLFVNYMLRTRHRKVIYLGATVPMADLVEVYEVHKPAYLYCFVTTTPTGKDLQQYVDTLTSIFPSTSYVFAGAQFDKHPITLPKNAQLMTNINDLLTHLQATDIKRAS